jgi:hypothetical protein
VLPGLRRADLSPAPDRPPPPLLHTSSGAPLTRPQDGWSCSTTGPTWADRRRAEQRAAEQHRTERHRQWLADIEAGVADRPRWMQPEAAALLAELS